MTREEALKILRGTHDKALFSVRNALETLIPELTESEDERITRAINNMLPFIPDEAYANNGVTKEDVLAWLEKQKECVADSSKTSAGEDERIRRVMLEHFKSKTKETWCGLSVANIIAWLEKKKELFKSGRGLYYYDGEKTTYCGYPATEDNPYDFAISQQEKQKEQKPISFNEPYNPDDYEVVMEGNATGLKRKEQNLEEEDHITPNKKFFQWIYDRLVNVHGENPDVDYMKSFKERINSLSFDKQPHWTPSAERWMR